MIVVIGPARPDRRGCLAVAYSPTGGFCWPEHSASPSSGASVTSPSCRVSSAPPASPWDWLRLVGFGLALFVADECRKGNSPPPAGTASRQLGPSP